jgi:5-methylcytosine-specific restriction endonuclease McrA
MKKKNRQTLLLNSDFHPLKLVHWSRAITLMYQGKATQIDFYKNDAIKDGHGKSYPLPAVIVLNKYIRRNYSKATFRRMAVFARDKFHCMYCEQEFKPSQLTLDHLIPRSKWKGTTSSKNWTNIVTACIPCNRRKADRTCEVACMYPMNLPVQPSYGEVFVGLHFYYDFEPEWETYLAILPGFKKVAELVN